MAHIIAFVSAINAFPPSSDRDAFKAFIRISPQHPLSRLKIGSAIAAKWPC